MYKLQNKTILIFSNEPWGDIWYSKHNWAFELAKKNQIYFINPALKWRGLNLFQSKILEENITSNLSVISYSNKFPYSRFKNISNINERILSKQLLIFLNISNSNDLIFWTFDPFRFTNPSLFNPEKSIYFITDKFQTKLEISLINRVDNIISVSPTLSPVHQNKKVLNLTHGISEEEFIQDENIGFDDFILYIGNIDHRVNYSLLKKILIEFPNEKLLFIGNVSPNENENFQELFIEKKYRNLIIKGTVHFKNLKNYIANAKLCLAIMQVGVHGNNINHHKLLQYLAFGKPILSPVFEDYASNDNIIIGYKDDNEAVLLVKKIIQSKEDDQIIQNRINFAKKHIYTNLIKDVEMFLSEK